MSFKLPKNYSKPLSNDTYYKLAQKEFNRILHVSSSEEKIFQEFFERNPCYLPGARGELESGVGPSGHGPHLDVLISQPKINGLASRSPDFIWFAYDSIALNPYLIEIEAPSKKYFNEDGTPTSQFTKAKNQLDEWKTILTRPENISKFLTDFNIPKSLTNLHFEPVYVLIYGRREEYSNQPWLAQKRAHLLARSDRQILMSYDRLKPQLANRNFICCNVKKGQYLAKCLTPTFKMDTSDDRLLEISNVKEAVDNMQFVNSSRKIFLKKYIPELLKYLKDPNEEEDNELVFDEDLIDYK